MLKSLSRRDVLKAGGLVAGAAMFGLPRPLLAAPARKRAIRVAHLTDLHIEPELHAGEGVAACLKHVRSQAEKPDLILLGGDCIMDSFESDDARTKTQWDLFSRVFKDENSTPVEACLGNHDIWGQNKLKSKTNGTEPGWGKRRAMDQLRLEKPYHSFDKAGWHFVCLDSVMPQGDGYIGKLDGEQWEWLESDLKATDARTPILVMSHIPILSATVIADVQPNPEGIRELSDGLMMTDVKRFVATFLKHPNVKACISGHIHEVDRVDYQGVSYLCNGAVCGNWWKGRHKQCDEGYTMMDLFDDGTFERVYTPYGWVARKD